MIYDTFDSPVPPRPSEFGPISLPVVAESDYNRSKAEIVQIKEIMDRETTPKEKCQAVWKLVSTSDLSNTIKS